MNIMPLETDPAIRRRRSRRLKGYDYSQAGAYFITICTHNHECMFGHISDGEMVLNDAGRIVHAVWDGLTERFPGLELDTLTVMPNHVHGIVIFVGALLAAPSTQGRASPAPTLGDVMRAFKSISAIRINRMMRRTGSLWQRNYYEHVIRGEDDLNDIRQYILDNPTRWADDENNPERMIHP
ncbi:MAG: transposase [Dehalococcoidia bacterium]|jgi:REP element-mobilizing transposase RayT